MNLIVSLLVMIGLVFGGGATVTAAQDDLPNQPLYRLKLMSEEANIWLARDPMTKIEMLMEQAQARIQEMNALAAEGVIPPAQLRLRAQERIEQALQIAAGLDDPALVGALEQIRDQLRIQEHLMLQDGSCAECEPVMDQTRSMLQTQLRDVQDDIANPRAFRERYRDQDQLRTKAGDCDPETPCDAPQYGSGEQDRNQNQEQEQRRNENGTSEPPGNGDGSRERVGPGSPGTQEPGGSGSGTQEPGGDGCGNGGSGDTGGSGGTP